MSNEPLTDAEQFFCPICHGVLQIGPFELALVLEWEQLVCPTCHSVISGPDLVRLIAEVKARKEGWQMSSEPLTDAELENLSEVGWLDISGVLKRLVAELKASRARVHELEGRVVYLEQQNEFVDEDELPPEDPR